MQQHVFSGKTDGYAPFVQDYVAALGDTAPHRLIGQNIDGVVPYQGDNGEVMVKSRGGAVMTWSTFILGQHHRRGSR